MERKNELSDNLKAYQKENHKTMTEFAGELGIPKSTLQAIMIHGNTTLDTTIRMANAMHITLDELVFGKKVSCSLEQVQYLLHEMGWYTALSIEKQDKIRYHVQEILKTACG